MLAEIRIKQDGRTDLQRGIPGVHPALHHRTPEAAADALHPSSRASLHRLDAVGGRLVLRIMKESLMPKAVRVDQRPLTFSLEHCL